jgi:hypothetical protein
MMLRFPFPVPLERRQPAISRAVGGTSGKIRSVGAVIDIHLLQMKSRSKSFPRRRQRLRPARHDNHVRTHNPLLCKNLCTPAESADQSSRAPPHRQRTAPAENRKWKTFSMIVQRLHFPHFFIL